MFFFLGCEDKCKEQSQLCDPSTMECYGIQLFSYKVSKVLQIKFLWIIFQYIGVFLKGPKLEIFGSRVFTQIRPVWVGDLGKFKILMV